LSLEHSNETQDIPGSNNDNLLLTWSAETEAAFKAAFTFLLFKRADLEAFGLLSSEATEQLRPICELNLQVGLLQRLA
jgi:hypothetical protein